MSNIFKLHQNKPTRLGHKKAKKNKNTQLEEKGQLNLFQKPVAKIFSLEKKLSPFEQAFISDEQGSSKAREYYLTAIDQNDHKADAYCNLGIIEASDGHYVKAIDHFSHALTIEPRHYEAHFNLANLYFDNDDLKLARLHYETAKEIEPNDPNIFFNLGLVQAMQEDIKGAIESLSIYSKMVGEKEALKANEIVNTLELTKKA